MTFAPTGLLIDLDDRYRLLEVIGRGGMATVYKAHDVKHDRTVALKVLHDDLAQSLGPERFKREILIAARLQHPHILSVFDSGETAGRLWFTMPFVQGESLRDRLRREGKLTVDAALTVVREAAQALAHAHKQGVIHRDIKPENILLTEDGSTLVADFGIARAIGDQSFEQGLTQTGSAIGTPTYMAPEQATGETVLDERVDQYALAAVLYELLTGSPPFSGANAAALIAARYTSAVTSVRLQRDEVPAEVDAAVLRALALKPFDRFPSITDFARAVAPSMSTPSQFDTHSRPRSSAPHSRRPWLAGVGLLAVVAVAGSGFLLSRRSFADAAPAGPVRIAVLPLQNLGDTSDAYFADGMSDELRAKLVSLPGIQVIARASSVQYAGTSKTPAEIAAELDVRYLLTGTLRYEHRADGSSEVHLRPELMEVRGNGPATTKWQSAFDEPLTNATALQSKIAAQVAMQLQVTLGATDRTRLLKAPTRNPDAYDAYLRGVTNWNDDSPGAMQRRIADIERATQLDPSFSDAWAALARANGLLFVSVAGSTAAGQRAREAAERARALAPNDIAGQMGWYWYHRAVDRDLGKAERALAAARKLEPNDPSNMARMAALLNEQGRLAEASPLYQDAIRLDPLNVTVWAAYGTALLEQRRYLEAREPLRRYAALAPASMNAVLNEVMLNVGMGDRDGARAAIREAYRRLPAENVDAFLAIYQDYGWVLDDDAQRRVLAAPLAAFDGDQAAQLIAQAHIHHARGELAASRQAAAAALPTLAANARRLPNEVQWSFIQGFAAALAGQRVESERFIRVGEQRAARLVIAPAEASYFAELRARIHTLNGDYDRALDQIEAALAKPGLFGRGQLALDPMWAPLRSLPRYQRIMATVAESELR